MTCSKGLRVGFKLQLTGLFSLSHWRAPKFLTTIEYANTVCEFFCMPVTLVWTDTSTSTGICSNVNGTETGDCSRLVTRQHKSEMLFWKQETAQTLHQLHSKRQSVVLIVKDIESILVQNKLCITKRRFFYEADKEPLAFWCTAKSWSGIFPHVW